MSAQPQNDAYKFRAILGGREYTQAQSQGLEYLLVEDHVDIIGTAKMCLNLDHGAWSSVQIGSDVEISVGQTSRKMFVGVVTGMRHSFKQGREVMTVVAMDPLIKASASRRTETYEKMTDADIVRQVIGKAGLNAGKIDSTTEKNDHVIQRNESDLEFMKRLAARNNYLVMANEGKVDFVKAQFGSSPIAITTEMLEDLDYEMNAASVPPEITSHGWDYVQTKRVEGTAGSGDIEAIGGGRNAVQAAAQIWKGTSYVTDVMLHSQGSAKDNAKSELNRLARNFLRGSARVDGNAEIHAGRKVHFQGHPTGFNPEVYVISSRHFFEFKRGYSTEFNFCSNTMPV
jgi:phage protein D